MKVLLLSPYGSAIYKTLIDAGDEVEHHATTTDGSFAATDWIVMFGWRKIIPAGVVWGFQNRIINIHGGYLPWNRGAYPNLFSWVGDTAKGASIHYVDEGIDTGNIIVRQDVSFFHTKNVTLRTSYDIIRLECEKLFERSWQRIRMGDVKGMAQDPKLGSYHTKAEGEAILAKLPKGWDTPVDWLKSNAALDEMVEISQKLGFYK
jgi:methionyl-tRNA formyltransferase